jgi:peptidoglycan hydrolase-like protein with peptidoglycan-binding domain
VRRVFKEIALEIQRAVVPSSTGYDQRVRQAQRRLSQIGFKPGPADGYWGQKTMTAIREFQAWYPREPLAVTGKLDDKTYQAISEAVRRGLKRKTSSGLKKN